MADRIKLVQGDTRPQILVSLTDSSDGTPIDLTGSTVRLYFRAENTTTIISTLVATLLPGRLLEDGTVSSEAPYNTAGAGGRAVFSWDSNSLTGEAGNYEGEIEVTFSGGEVQTLYDVVKFKMRADF